MASWLSNFWNSFFKKPLQALNNKVTGQALTPAEREANSFTANQAEIDRAFQANEAEKARAWEQQMSDTSYQRQIADMKAAGVNPALALGGSASGASTPSSPSPSGAMASSVSPESGTGLGDILQLLSFSKQMQKMNAEISNIEADTHNKDADTASINERTKLIGPEFDLKLRSMDNEERKTYLQEVSTQISRDLTAAEISKMEVEKDSLRQHIKESEQNVKESVSRVSLNAATEALRGAEAYQIYALLPYVQALKDAETQSQIAQASYYGVQTAYQNGLIDKGYIDQLVKKVAAEADIDVYGAQSAQVSAYLDKLHYAMRTGQYFSDEDASQFGKAAVQLQNGIIRGFSTFCDQFKPLTTLGSAAIISAGRK